MDFYNAIATIPLVKNWQIKCWMIFLQNMSPYQCQMMPLGKWVSFDMV